jgi:hypothetical protein
VIVARRRDLKSYLLGINPITFFIAQKARGKPPAMTIMSNNPGSAKAEVIVAVKDEAVLVATWNICLSNFHSRDL